MASGCALENPAKLTLGALKPKEKAQTARCCASCSDFVRRIARGQWHRGCNRAWLQKS